MAYKPGSSDAFVELTWDELERTLSQFCATNGIKTDAAWSNYINTRTDAEIVALMRAYLKRAIGVGRTP